jgi:DNA-binding NarL/FixJ family response regulator
MRTTAMAARFVAFLPSTEDVRYACRAAAIVQGQPLADEGRRLLDRLTPKQAEVFWLLVAGHDAQAIAYRLEKSYTAINERLVRVRRAFGVDSDVALVAKAAALGLVRPPEADNPE